MQSFSARISRCFSGEPACFYLARGPPPFGARKCGGAAQIIQSSPFPHALIARGMANKSSRTYLPPLMAGPRPVWWPRVCGSLRMSFQVRNIRKNLDPEFDLEEFMKGAQQALFRVSQKLSQRDFTDIEEIIHPEAMAEIKSNLSNFTPEQLAAIKISPTDAMISFPYKIRIITPHQDSGADILAGKPSQKHEVHVLVVFHVWRGITEEELKGKKLKEYFQEEIDRIYTVCNYSFYRIFENGSNSAWMLNLVSHFSVEAHLPELFTEPKRRSRRNRKK